MSTRVAVGQLASQVRGVSYKKTDASSTPRPETVGVVRAGNIVDGDLTIDNLVYVPAAKVTARQLLRKGDVLIATSSGSINVVGKAARIRRDEEVAFGAFCKVLRPVECIDSSYFAHYFQTATYRDYVSRVATGTSINNLKTSHLAEIEILLPPIGEQKRIAALLDAAEALRAKRRQVLATLDSLTQAIFIDMFGDPIVNPLGWQDNRVLADVAEVRSGITKGRKTGSGPLMAVPYLAVVNVQDGFIQLDPLKSIDATSAEIEKYALNRGDIVLTEGGDPDKLGRGAVWHGQVDPCIHQNHVFRVRLLDDRMRPEYLGCLLASPRGKRYFLRMAKQTTGIASINMTQLRTFPLLEPPRGTQDEFIQRLSQVQEARETIQRSMEQLDALFDSLQQRAFRGEL